MNRKTCGCFKGQLPLCSYCHKGICDKTTVANHFLWREQVRIESWIENKIATNSYVYVNQLCLRGKKVKYFTNSITNFSFYTIFSPWCLFIYSFFYFTFQNSIINYPSVSLDCFVLHSQLTFQKGSDSQCRYSLAYFAFKISNELLHPAPNSSSSSLLFLLFWVFLLASW